MLTETSVADEARRPRFSPDDCTGEKLLVAQPLAQERRHGAKQSEGCELTKNTPMKSAGHASRGPKVRGAPNQEKLLRSKPSIPEE